MRVMLLAPLLWSLVCAILQAQHGTVSTVGDIGQFAVPLAGLAVTLLQDDIGDGGPMLVGATALALATTYALKYGFNRQRPNGGIHSFPSGHTTAAFSGAAFLHRRYGVKIGIPAYAAATFVGYSRVASEQHHVSDVLTGAGIGIAWNLPITKRLKRNLSVSPLVGRDVRGIRVTFSF